MLKFFGILSVFLLSFPAVLHAQEKEIEVPAMEEMIEGDQLTEEMISDYLAETAEVSLLLSEDLYEEWVGKYLDHESQLIINEDVTSPKGVTQKFTMTLSKNQFWAKTIDELERTKSSRMTNLENGDIKIAKNKKSAFITRSYNLISVYKANVGYKKHDTDWNCTEVLLLDEWGNMKLARSLCEVKKKVSKMQKPKNPEDS